MFLGLRKLSELPIPGLSEGGILWFTNLAVMDPTYALPLIASGTMLVVMELNAEGQQAAGPVSSAGMKNVFRVLICLGIPFTATFPAVSYKLLCTFLLSKHL
jgi:YidC/Oxa1 family membrane protein insertase